MQVRQLMIDNFRGVQSGSVRFDGDALLVGGNSVGKSTVCEALDLVLGPERMFRRPVVDEWDFWAGLYQRNGETTPEIRIEVIITDLSDEAERRFRAHLRRWDVETAAFVRSTEEGGTFDDGQWCLPVGFIARYNPDEDDFDGGTFFLHPQQQIVGDSQERVDRN
jgi:putative ATP-dependent endonuclease of OLD family